jgi:hypothetical protein
LVGSNRFQPDIVGQVGYTCWKLRTNEAWKIIADAIGAYVADNKAGLVVVREWCIAMCNQLTVEGLDGACLAKPRLDFGDDLIE